MRGVVAVLLSYGCLAIVATLLFTSSAYAAPADRDLHEGKLAPLASSECSAPNAVD